MKRTWIVALLLLIAAGGYYWYATQNAGMEAPEAMTETTPDAAPAAPAAPAVEEPVSIQTLLTPEGFDAAKLSAAIDAFEGVDAGLKQVLKQAVELAGQDPSIIPETIDQVKAGLGL